MEILNSWKEIADYLGRGVRTVQRWERDLGLPVHRPKGHDRTAVLAFPQELEEWLHHTPVRSQLGAGDGWQNSASEEARNPWQSFGNEGPPRALALARARVEVRASDVLRACARTQQLRDQMVETARRQQALTTNLQESLRKLTRGQRPTGAAA